MKMFKIIFLLLSFFCFLKAEDSASIFDLLDKKEQQFYIEKEFDNLEKNQKQERNLPLDSDEIMIKTYIFKKIEFKNKDDLTAKTDKLLQKYLNTPLNLNDIYNIIKELTNFILSKGYSTSAIDIERIDGENQTLVLDIKYGFVGEVYLNDDDNTTRLDFGMSLKNGDKFNIFDLDTGIENLSNGASNVKALIKASKEYGYSDIFITSEAKPFDFMVDSDNSGDKSTGKTGIHLTYNNPLNINDSVRFSFIKGLLKDMRNESEDVYGVNYTLPIQSYQLNYSLQYSDNKDLIEGYNSNFTRKSTNLRHKATLKKILHRSSNDKFSVYVNFDIKENTNKVDDIFLEISSAKHSSIASGIEYVTTAIGGFLFLNLEYQKGVPFFGAKKDDKNSLYKVEFNKINANLTYQKNFYINDSLALLYKSSIGGSYSNEPLLYADKFLIGDEYTIRGFKKSSAALDYGIYDNNTIFFHFLNASKYLSALEPFIGFDIGYGRDYFLPNKDVLAGVAFGARYNLDNIYLSLTASKALHKSSNMPSETIPIYLRASLSF
ncbi:ShlB/FhaC/HecB family hemolysin secretion/activation protein [Campylobacter fetus]|uniref:ShlB/FhaC/HecB family hemolysin secretion/activation protein n=1 Tax=Campylobacter fetus TaxID=196 RepID=UPI00073AD20C|nr:ShlB/FhaC/HecB family hemolysin secretion/activation protein [Campylobacter fetus]ALV64763.1 hemolysin secretion/activation protein, ShlB/FhaC/HecB family [Campylobacter fetus subsp. testudinum Sp3]